MKVKPRVNFGDHLNNNDTILPAISQYKKMSPYKYRNYHKKYKSHNSLIFMKTPITGKPALINMETKTQYWTLSLYVGKLLEGRSTG